MHAVSREPCGTLRLKATALGLSVLLLVHDVVQAVNRSSEAYLEHGVGASNTTSEATSGNAVDSREVALHHRPSIFAEPSSEVSHLATRGGEGTHALERRLARYEITWDLNESATALTMYFEGSAQSSPLSCPDIASCGTVVGLYAGQKITRLANPGGGGIDIIVDPDTFGKPTSNGAAKLRFVRSAFVVDETDARAPLELCRPQIPVRYEPSIEAGAFEATVSGSWALGGAATMVVFDASGQPTGQLKAKEELTFYQGGQFKICYSDTGEFRGKHADVVPYVLDVYGVFDINPDCAQRTDCLQTRQYFCYLLRESYNNIPNSRFAQTSCVVDYETDGKGFRGPIPTNAGSWSSAFDSPVYRTLRPGVIAIEDGYSYPQPCGKSNPADFLCRNGSTCDVGNPWFAANASSDTKPYPKGTLPLPANRPDLDPGGGGFRPYTVAACYCPGDFGGCLTTNDFLQQVGIMHYFVTKVCVPGTDAQQIEPAREFTGSTPQHRFAVRIECPTNACSITTNNRMMIIAQRPENDYPSWRRDPNGGPGTGCGMTPVTEHGKNKDGKLLLLPSAPNLDISQMSGDLPGDSLGNQKFKVWNYKDDNFEPETAGFLFVNGYTDYELRNFPVGETFDVCFCDDNCANPLNWFKSGQLRFASFRLLPAVSYDAQTSEELLLEYVNQPGTVIFARPIPDYHLYGLEQYGMLKMVEDNALTLTDDGCESAIYDRYLIDRNNGGHQEKYAATRFAGVTPAAPDADRLVFNGGDSQNLINVLKAGTLAICYCVSVASNLVEDQCVGHWVLAARLTVRGPAPNQEWTFSTYVVFRFDFSGWGLTNDDKIRIIPSTSDCSDDAGNPSGVFDRTNIRVMCPHPCSDVGKVTDVLNGDIDVAVLDDQNYKCDKQNSGCQTNYVRSVEVISDNETEVEFEAAPYLEDGDLISLKENVECDRNDLEADGGNCNDLKLSVLKGIYSLSTSGHHSYVSSNTFVGHRVTPTSDITRVIIPVGWKSDQRPKFKVYPADGHKGRWTRHSKAITREEILGTRNRVGMKVCWKYPGPLGKYTIEAGRLNLIPANPMAYALVSLVTTVVNQKAPLIVSFRTAGAQTGLKYQQVQGPTQLKIYFRRDVALDVHRQDGANIVTNKGEDEIVDARQYICGKIFMELWSDDSELGFPMPSGCYYKTYGMTKELNMVFHEKNGLSPGTTYMFVVKGTAKGEAREPQESPKRYVEIFTMDDVTTKPYEAIEHGYATLEELPEDPAYGLDGVRFLHDDGMKLVGGQGANMYQLESGSYLNMELKGDPNMGGIKANSLLRIFLRPLLMWNVEKLCSAMCTPFDEVTAPCGKITECNGDSIVPNMNRNFVTLRLPDTMATMTEYIFHTVSVTDLLLPEQGFFMTTVGGQISTPDDIKPDYIESVGDFLWKAPNEGISVGKIVDVYGDGNARPFKQQNENILYASITLSATLFSSIDNGDAKFTIILPDGYVCRMPGGDIDGMSPWRTPSTLDVFGGQSPQGTGSPDEGSGARGWSVFENTCIFTVAQFGVVYAGSALLVRITVNNPDFPYKRYDTANRWSLNMTSKGYGTRPQTVGPLNFKTSGLEDCTHNRCGMGYQADAFIDNQPVLGRITKAVLFPSRFDLSVDSNNVVRSRVRFIFQTEQDTGAPGSVEILGPESYIFDNPCVAKPLPKEYYFARPELVTKRLPCVDCVCTAGRWPENHMKVSLTGSLLANTFYAFETEVANPYQYNEHTQVWRIFTVDPFGYRVDGTPDTIELLKLESSLAVDTNLANKSYPLCENVLNADGFLPRFRVQVSDYRPYSMTYGLSKIEDQKTALVNVWPLRAPKGITGRLRLTIIAPEGYQWRFTDNDFLYKQPKGSADPACNPVIMDDANTEYEGENVPGDTPSAPTACQCRTRCSREPRAIAYSWVDPTTYQGPETEYGKCRCKLEVRAKTKTTGVHSALVEIYRPPFYDMSSESNAILENAGEYVSKDLPGGNKAIPERNGNVLLWKAAPWDPDQFYGFQARIIVPDYTRTSSANSFVAVFSYDDVNNTCAGAATWEISPTNSLVNAHVDYVTNVNSRQTDLTFTLRTISPIPAGGRIRVLGPLGFDFNGGIYPVGSCTPQAQHNWANFFQASDSDNNAFLDVAEFISLCRRVDGLGLYMVDVAEAKLEEAFKALDLDDPGEPEYERLSLEELQAFNNEGLKQASGERGSPYEVLATEPFVVDLPLGNVRCVSEDEVATREYKGGQGKRALLTIYVADTELPPGRYRWTVGAFNPRQEAINPAEPSPCGTRYCWQFMTFQGKLPCRDDPRDILRGNKENCDDLVEASPYGCNTWQYSGNVPEGLDCDNGHCYYWELCPNKCGMCPADKSVFAKSYEITQKLVEAFFPTLTDSQRATSGRNDRPGHSNPLIFAFKLQKSMLDPAYMTIRGPLGFIFREDCLVDIDTRGDEVFGPGVPLPETYKPWVKDVIVKSCRGEGPNAYLYLDPGVSYGLRSEQLYPFRMTVMRNPITQPYPFNMWTIDYAGESSDPFEGFQLWTFTRTSVHTVSHALTSTETNVALPKNPITFTFRPHNTVSSKGMQITITAPPGFRIAQKDGTIECGDQCHYCEMMVQPVFANYIAYTNADPNVAPDPEYGCAASLLWGLADVECKVPFNRDQPNYLVATVLADIREMTKGRDYQVTIFVHNPSFAPSPEENVFKLETADSPEMSGVLPTFRDEIELEGFELNDRARFWLYRNENPATKETYIRGQQDVRRLYLEFVFARNLQKWDEIVVEAPLGFFFTPSPDATSMCPSFAFEQEYFQDGTPKPPPLKDPLVVCADIPSGCQRIPNADGCPGVPTPPACARSTLTILITDINKVPQMTSVKFYVDTVNPPKTPHVMENNWLVYHYTTMEPGTKGPRNPKPLASEMARNWETGSARSWDIKPQLKQMAIVLVGERKAAGMSSEIAISFVPVSNADELEIKATLPQGFDFTGCTATSTSHEVIATNIESLRVRAAMYAEVQASVRIAKFRLGYVGGPTEFDLITRLSSGIKKDESLNFRGGFRLPGHLDVLYTAIQSKWQLQPNVYDVASLWGVRMAESAQVEFHFSVTMDAELGFMIVIRAPQYTLTRQVFDIRRTGANAQVISTEVISDYGGELVARLGTKLFAGIVYELTMSVVTPSGFPNPEDATWSIEVDDGGALPVNTNDGMTEGFQLVDKLPFSVAAARAPPLAEVGAELALDPKAMLPEEGILVAPPGFNFTADCLLEPGDNNEVISCTRQAETVAGRASALIVFQAGGLAAPPQYVMIRIITPPDNQDDRSWFLKVRKAPVLGGSGVELGWGEDSIGVEVRQMVGANVLYPGIPGVDGWMAFRFITNEKVEAGGKIKVVYPKSLTIRCNDEYFEPVSLEGETKCEVFPRQGFFEVSMVRPLPPGTQAFAVTSTAPPGVKEENKFSILIYSPDDKVIDAAMSVPGLRIQHGLKVVALPIIWSNSEANRPARVNLGFELLEDLPEKNPPTMEEIVVTVPQDFSQEVKLPRHLEPINTPLPYGQGTCGAGQASICNIDPKRLQIFLDTTKTVTLTPGQYRFAFPVMVPARVPAYNVFTMTICGPTTSNETCYGPEAARALASFPWPGFNLGESHPEALQYSMSAGGAIRSVSCGATMIVTSALAALAAWRSATAHGQNL